VVNVCAVLVGFPAAASGFYRYTAPDQPYQPEGMASGGDDPARERSFEPFDQSLRTQEATDAVTDLHVVFSNRKSPRVVRVRLGRPHTLSCAPPCVVSILFSLSLSLLDLET
jgi:hypothetical protein